MKRSPAILMFALVAASAWPRAGADVIIDYALRSTAGFEADGDRSLGGGGGVQAGFLNLAPRVLFELNPDWMVYARARAFVPSGKLLAIDNSSPNNETQRTGAFVGLNELLLQYNGLTSYPVEALSLGRQHIRQVGGEFWDQDIDALRWVFDTTRRGVDLGFAHQFSTYRSDAPPIIASQRRRSYAFADVAFDWQPGQRFGARVVQAFDGGHAPEIGSTVTGDSKLAKAHLTWLGLYANDGFYDPLSRDRLDWWAELNYLLGHETLAVPGGGGVVASHQSQTLGAYAGTAALRWRPFAEVPVAFGGLYTYSSGGGSRQYQQTGVQSNASTFAGTQALVNRYNEALRAELGNLRVATLLVSLNLADNDLSAIVSNFARNSSRDGIVTNSVSAPLVNGSSDIGNGLDVVATHYFGRNPRPQRLLSRRDAYVAQERRSLIALRASAFLPGSAYGSGAKTDYRVTLEATLWIN